MRTAIIFALCFWFSLQLTWKIFGQEKADRPPIIEEGREPQYKNGYVWYQLEGRRDQFGLWHHNKQVGTYDFATGFYWLIENGKPSRIAVAPICPPFTRAMFGGEPTLFGVASTKLREGPRVWDGDGEYTLAYLTNLLEADLRDDSRAGHLSAIVREPSRRRKIDQEWDRVSQGNTSAGKVRWQSYDAEHPVNRLMLAPFQLDKDEHYKRTGFALIAQAAAADKDGKSRPQVWHEYRGEETLREGLRVVDPHYNPCPPILPLAPWRIDLSDTVWLVAGAAILGLLLLLACSIK